MRVCIPTMGEKGLDESIGTHFGRVPTYTIVDTETNAVDVIKNTSHHMGGAGHPPEIIKGQNVETVICSNLGHNAITMFENLEICVYIGAYGKVKDAIRMWKGDMLHLATPEGACDQHAFRGEKRDSGHACGH